MKFFWAIVITILAASLSPAGATDLSQVLTDLQNMPLKDRVTIEGKETLQDLTAGRVISNSLLVPTEDDRTTSVEVKARKFLLAMKTGSDPKAITLTTDDVALIKSSVSKAYPGALILGRILQIIAPNDLDAAAKH